jgi:hypothetical protein
VTAPTLRVVGGGEPTDEELAAIVAAVSLLRARSGRDREATESNRWRRSARASQPWRRDGWLAVSRRRSLRGGH